MVDKYIDIKECKTCDGWGGWHDKEKDTWVWCPDCTPYHTEWDTNAKSWLEVGIDLGILNKDGSYVKPVWRTRKIGPKNQQGIEAITGE